MGALDAENGTAVDSIGEVGDRPIRMHLSVPLPCGMGDCRRPASEALAEPDPACPGAWVLLPICPTCGADAQAGARRIATSD